MARHMHLLAGILAAAFIAYGFNVTPGEYSQVVQILSLFVGFFLLVLLIIFKN